MSALPLAINGLQGPPIPGTPPQLTDGETVTTGDGFTVMVKLIGVPVHAPVDGVTVIVAVTAVALLFNALKEAIFPEPLDARPIEVVLFTQLKVVAVPVKLIAVVAVLLHTTWFETGFTSHCALAFVHTFTVIKNNKPDLKNRFLKLPFPLCKWE